MILKKFLSVGICFGVFAVGILTFNVVNQNKTNVLGASNKQEVVRISGSTPNRDKDEVVAESDIIARGKVREILPSKWSNPNFEKGENIPNVLQTDIVVKLNKIYKGNPQNGKEVVIRMNYGSDENIKVISDGYPKFSEKEDVLVFLSKDDSILADDSKEYYVLTGMFQGKYNFDGKNNFVLKKNGKNETINANDIENEFKKENQKYKNRNKKKYTEEEIDKINSELFIDNNK